jgi:thiaminase/transcriptional activator TenA
VSFTDTLWRRIDPIFTSILGHPLIGELSEGTLSRERFVFYMQQDSLYLRDFSRALGQAGVRSPDPLTQQAFLNFGANALSVEHALHEGYFEAFGVKPAEQKAPACFAYTNYLLACAAVEPYPVAVAALLPCFWIYREAGNHIFRTAQQGLDMNPYRRWIETYSGEAFNESVERAIGIVEGVAAGASNEDRERMAHAFETSSRLEWMFWDSAYRLEQWPPG